MQFQNLKYQEIESTTRKNEVAVRLGGSVS